MSPTKRLYLPLLCLVTGAACTGAPTLGQDEAELARIPRGSTCAQLGLGDQQLTLPGPVAAGSYALDAQNSLSLTYYDDSNTIFFFNQATVRITGVLVSIGAETLVWDIPGGSDAWPSLHGPIDTTTGFLSPAEEVSFCYDYELRIQPSPYANLAQRSTWSISKTGRTDRLVLSEGQSELVEYDVTVRPGAPAAEGQFVAGPVFVLNRSPHTVTVGTVNTMVGELAAEVTCPLAPPFVLAPFSQVVCEFRADVPDTNDRNVVGSGSVSHGLKVSTQEVVVTFANGAATTTIDDCVDVSDDAVPGDHFLGRVCTAQGETTFSFSSELGPFACGAFAVTTTASYLGADTGATADASWTVNGDVVCNPGCTLSQHYWKVHSHFGPRRYNPIWDLVGPQGEDTAFFLSGGSYVQALWRKPQGNSYWTLSKAYIAAKLNRLNGAQFPPATLTAFNNATSLLTGNTPAQVAASQTLRKNFVKAAVGLKDFNSGRTGPGRCTCKPDLDDED